MLAGKIHTAHPVCYVRDLSASVSFYRDRLGLPLDWLMEPQKLAAIRINDGAIIVLCENPAKSNGPAAPVLVFNIDDVDAAYARLQAAGVVFDQPPCDEFYGRAVELRDPDGYRLCLVSSDDDPDQPPT